MNKKICILSALLLFTPCQAVGSTQEFGYIKVADPYVQASSIMPQKRNLVPVEHMRSLLSAASGDCVGILMMLQNTPYGDIVDTEDDAQPRAEGGHERSTCRARTRRASGRA